MTLQYKLNKILSAADALEYSDSLIGMIAIFFIAFAVCDGFTEYQQTIVRQRCVDQRAPQSSAIIDAILARDYAFTDQQRLLTHIDGSRFQCCPNSFSNVVTHEIHHLNGRHHNIAFVKDDPMSYSLTVLPTGVVIEDNFLLPPLAPSQPWAHIFAPSPLAPSPLPPTIVSPLPAAHSDATIARKKRASLPVRMVSFPNGSSAAADGAMNPGRT